MLSIGIDSIKDLVETIALVVGVVTIIWGVLTYRITRNQFNFSVMISCIERFQQILPQINSNDTDVRFQAIKMYVDLCNEELFYFKNKFVPNDVVDEWIEGMLYYLPWFDEKGRNLNPKVLPEIIDRNLLKDYPRMCHAFKVNRPYDLDILNERIRLINLIKHNLKENHYQIE